MTEHRIDFHCHFLPDFYRQALVDAGHEKPDGIKALPKWSEESAIDMMNKVNIQHTCLSISSPGVHFGDDAKAQLLSRQVNEEAARLAKNHPGRFSFFASLPLPDNEAAKQELIYAMDKLGAIGMVMGSNLDGRYAGDNSLFPIYHELNQRGGILFVHPTTPNCHCGSNVSSQGNSFLYPAPVMEYMFETTRTITHLIHAGILDKFPDIKILVPHAGAALCLLSSRIDLAVPMLSSDDALPLIKPALKKLYFDLAGIPVPDMLPILLNNADLKKIVYGSDYPFTPLPTVLELAKLLDSAQYPHPTSLHQIMTSNATQLLGSILK
tara:strand:- start:13878 stop:14849 length:972 start_codon:yes stop_codon:yes gene_type:complete